MNNDLWEYKHDLKCMKIVGMLLNGQPAGKIIDEMQSLYLVNNTEVRYNDGSHYTKDEHGRFTGSTSSSGSSSGSVASGENIGAASHAHSRNIELEEMIQRCVNEPTPVFSDDLKPFFDKIPKEHGKYILALHGNPDNVYLFGMEVDDRILANIIKSRKDYNGENEIVLISCNTGNTSGKNTCFAKRLADRLGKTVIAPTSYGSISSTGKYYSSNRTGTIREGEFKPFNPDVKGG